MDASTVRRLMELGAFYPLEGVPPRPAQDHELLGSLGVGTVRVAVDWPTLQPRPGPLDPSAVEALEVQLAGWSETPVWVCLFDGAAPGWFLDDGGFTDERTSGRWWPRFVDEMAQRVGDRVAGWVPLVNPVAAAVAVHPEPSERQARLQRALMIAWRDAWLVLRGGGPLVATLLRAAPVALPEFDEEARQAARRLDHLLWRTWPRALRDGTVVVPGLGDLEVPELAGALDVLGCWFRAPAGVEPERWADDLGLMVRRMAEDGPERPVQVTLTIPDDDEARRRALADASVSALDEAVADGVPVEVVWCRAIGPASTGALADADREANPTARAWADALPRS